MPKPQICLMTMKNNINKYRLIFLAIVISLFWCAVIYRLIDIQIVHGMEYSEQAQKQSSGKIKVPAERGLIYDRKGRQVAINVVRNALCAYPSDKREIKKIYKYLDKIYGRRSGVSARKYRLALNRFRYIDRDLSDKLTNRLIRDSIPGLFLKSEIRRKYPIPGVGRQLLGGTDIDGRGVSGLEFSSDSILAGRPGLIDYLRDAHRNIYCVKEVPLIKPVPGNSIVLTIDWYFQEIVEEELRAAVEKYNALEGSALFLDCRTGEILAAADYIAGGKADIIKLRAISNCFEPGSVFKVFTTAALLEEGLIDFEERIYCEKGVWKCGRKLLHDDKPHDSLTFREIFEHSSNIGIGKLAGRLGGEKLYEAAHRFGFGEKCMTGLPGEQPGSIVRAKVWSDYNIAALSIGHAVATTPLQLVVGVAAVANGGRLYRPTVIRGVINDEGELISRSKTELIAEVMDEENADTLRSFMRGVVERGTAMLAQSDFVTIAGKTGTAQVADLKNGGYLRNKYNASFLGFFPANNPRVAGIVVLSQPEPVHYGGHTAGPAFKNIAERYSLANLESFRPENKMPVSKNELGMIEIPSFINMDIALAKQVARKKGIQLTANTESGPVVWQYPPEGRRIPGRDIVAVMVQYDETEEPKMFDLTGMKVRTAMAVLDRQRIKYEIIGGGIVKKQVPAEGVGVKNRSVCRLTGSVS